MRHITLLLALICTAAGYAQPATDSSGAFVLGTVRKIHSAVLGENRVLNIYLPAGYGHNDTAHYPVTSSMARPMRTSSTLRGWCSSTACRG